MAEGGRGEAGESEREWLQRVPCPEAPWSQAVWGAASLGFGDETGASREGEAEMRTRSRAQGWARLKHVNTGPGWWLLSRVLTDPERLSTSQLQGAVAAPDGVGQGTSF